MPPTNSNEYRDNPPVYSPYNDNVFSQREADYDDEDPPEYDYTFEKPKLPQESEKFEESFKIEKQNYNDKFFTFTFLATLLIFTWLAQSAFKDLLQNKSVFAATANITDDDDLFVPTGNFERNKHTLLYLIGLCVGVPAVSAIGMLALAYIAPMFFVFLGFLLIPLSFFGIAFTSLVTGAIFPAIMFFVFGFLMVMFLFNNYNKLSFTGLMFKIVIEVMSLYPSTLVVSLLSSVFSCLIGFTYFILSSGIFLNRIKKDDADCPHQEGNDICVSNTSTGISIFVLFVGYYIFEVLANFTHVVISGIFGTWYFFHFAALKPRLPAWGSFKRAITYSFGSICFGSLIVSSVKTLRVTLQLLKNKVQNRRYRDFLEGNGVDATLMCVLYCILTVLEFISQETEYWIKWFNKFAYSYLALYGKDYRSSAKDTFEILKFKGILILITDSLINSTLTFYSILVVLVSSGLYYLGYTSVSRFQELSSEFLIIGFILQIILSYFITKITLNSINSGFITFLIALCIKPEIFEENYHDYFVKLSNYYPEISHTLKVPFPDN